MRAITILETATSQRLTEQPVIQKHEVSVLDAIYQVLDHFSMHAGQIMFTTDMLTGSALDLEHDLHFIAEAHATRPSPGPDRIMPPQVLMTKGHHHDLLPRTAPSSLARRC